MRRVNAHESFVYTCCTVCSEFRPGQGPFLNAVLDATLSETCKKAMVCTWSGCRQIWCYPTTDVVFPIFAPAVPSRFHSCSTSSHLLRRKKNLSPAAVQERNANLQHKHVSLGPSKYAPGLVPYSARLLAKAFSVSGLSYSKHANRCDYTPVFAACECTEGRLCDVRLRDCAALSVDLLGRHGCDLEAALSVR